MKRTLLAIIALVVLSLLVLVSCGGGDIPPSDDDQTGDSVHTSGDQTPPVSPDPEDPEPENPNPEDPEGPTPDNPENPEEPEPAEKLVGIEFNGGSFSYDTKEHSIEITGNVPKGVSVTYSGGENGRNGATNVGSYKITATLSGDGYQTLTLTATLKITSKEELLITFVSGNKVYFQNALDYNRLYCYDGAALTKVNNDIISDMIGVKDEIYYLSDNLLSKSINKIDRDGNVSSLLEVSANELVSDGTYLYYNVNSLVGQEKTGIYKVSIEALSGEETEAVPVKLTGVKSEYLTLVNGMIYFSNKGAGSKLYCIPTDESTLEPTLIYNYKSTDIITDGSKLYFTRDFTITNPTFGAAIYSIDISGGLNEEVYDDGERVEKITVSKGKYLARIDDQIYFVNTDMVTSTIFGDGIYSASSDGSGWVGDTISLLIGSTKIVDGADDNLFSLSSDGTYLYYYRANTRHLYRYDIENGEEIDLMKDYVVPEVPEIIITYYEKAEYYDEEMYFINMKDGGRLYKYVPKTGAQYRLTGMQVADFGIYDGYIYFTTVRFLVNFDLYRMSLANGEPEALSTQKCMNFSFVGQKIYYTNYSGDNTLNSMNLDGTDDKILYGDPDKGEEKVGAAKTMAYAGYIYFEADNTLYRYSLSTETAEIVSKDLDPIDYIIYDDKILVVNEKGTNAVSLYDLNAKTVSTVTKLTGDYIVQSDDARGLFVYEDSFYFYRNIAAGSSKKGLYRVDKDGAGYKATLVGKIEGYYMCETMVVGSKAYFIDVWKIKDTVPTTNSTAKIFSIDLETLEVSSEN